MISRGIETVTKGMMALLDYQDVTAHNLANVTTDGYKKSNITFQDVMQANITTKTTDDKSRKVGTLSNGVRTDRTYIDFSQGGLSETGNKTDLAFDGNGFFKVRFRDIPDNAPYNEKNYYYQRLGNFKLDTENYLINNEGDYVMDTRNRRIRIARDQNATDINEMNRMEVGTDLIISETGQIQLRNEGFSTNLQTIQVVDFDDKTKVSQIGQSKFLPIYGQDAGLHQLKVGEYSIQQGMLEMSNANTINEMLNTINISRGYESMAKILKSESDSIQQAVRVGNLGS